MKFTVHHYSGIKSKMAIISVETKCGEFFFNLFILPFRNFRISVLPFGLFTSFQCIHSVAAFRNAGGMPSIFSQCHCPDIASYYGTSCCNLNRYANNGSIR